MQLKLLFENSEIRIIEIRYTDIDPFKRPDKSVATELHDDDEFSDEDEAGDPAVIRKMSNGAIVYEHQPREYDPPKRIVVYPTGAVKCYKDWTDFEKSELYPAFLSSEHIEKIIPFEENDYTEFKHVFNSLWSQI